MYQGEIPKDINIIQDGVVRAYNILSNGEERTIELLSEGDIVASHWAFGHAPATLYYYSAFTDVILQCLHRDEFEKRLQDAQFARAVMESTARRLAASTMHVNALLQTYAGAKVAHGLQLLLLSSGKKLPNGMFKINIRLTQQDIADLVGITRETAALELNKLKTKKIIAYKGFTYTVNYEALIRRSGGDEFLGLSI